MAHHEFPPLTNPVKIDINRIMACIPHRYPLLLVDKIVSLTPHQEAVGLKAVSIGEPYFQGHFPSLPIMPGVLIIESMAQTSAVLVVESLDGEAENKLVFFMSIEEAKFRRPVGPGDLLYLHVVKLQQRGAVWKFSGQAYVEGQKVAESIFTAMIRDKS